MTTKFTAHVVTVKEITDSWDESPFAETTESLVDEQQRTIKSVCIFGKRESLNGYTYEPRAVDTLSRLAHNARFFIDHPSKSEAKDRDGVRSVRDWAGMFTSPRKEGDKVYADLHVRPAFWELVKDVATMKPAGIGNSINSVVKVFKDGKGKESILDIERLKSVDLVASAATTQNLFESIREDKGVEVEEGLLKEKIAERELSRQVDNIQYEASDMIREIMRDKTKSVTQKKEEVTEILSDLEAEIAKIMSGKGTKVDSSAMSPQVALPSNKEEDEEMDWTKATLEALRKERPDLLKGIEDELEGTKKVSTMEKDLTETKAKMEDLQKQLKDAIDKVTALEKERDELKVKLDSFESKEKKVKKESEIATMIEAAKLPKEAVTEVFMKMLLGKDDTKDIEEAIKDRAAIWGAKPPAPVVKNAGDEFKEVVESKGDAEPNEKKTKFLKMLGK